MDGNWQRRKREWESVVDRGMSALRCYFGCACMFKQ